MHSCLALLEQQSLFQASAACVQERDLHGCDFIDLLVLSLLWPVITCELFIVFLDYVNI